MVGLLLMAMLASADPCEGLESDGRAFATCFDPWRGVELEGAFQANTGGVTGMVGAGIRLRGERESRSKAESTWLALHRLGATALRSSGGALAISVLGYSGMFRRHVREGVLLLPLTLSYLILMNCQTHLLLSAIVTQIRVLQLVNLQF